MSENPADNVNICTSSWGEMTSEQVLQCTECSDAWYYHKTFETCMNMSSKGDENMHNQQVTLNILYLGFKYHE